MNISEKVAYLKGLADGMAIDKSSNEGKLLLAILEVMGDMADNIDSLEFELDVISDELEDLDGDVAYLFDEEDDSCSCEHSHHHGNVQFLGNDYTQVICPGCNSSLTLTVSDLDEGEVECPKCGEMLEIDFDDMFDSDESLHLDVE